MSNPQKTALQAIEDELRAAKHRVKALEAAKAALSSNVIEPTTPQPGNIMPDGTVYVGVSLTTGRPLYAMPHDIEGRYSFIGALNAASAQTFGCHADWRLPTENELNQLYEARYLIEGFTSAYYWSCENRGSISHAWSRDFVTNTCNPDSQNIANRVRCVRSG